MRHKGSISHVNLERSSIILDLYNKAKATVQWPSDTMTICETAASLPVNKFYISSDSAIVYVRRRYYNDKTKIFRSPYKQRLYDALYEKFIEIVSRPENNGRSLPELVLKVLQQPAPCLGLAPFQLYMAVLRQKKKLK